MDSTVDNAPARRLRAALDAWTPRLRGITEDESATRLAGSWSARELLGHLVDSAQVNLERFLRARTADHLDFPGYPQDEWVALNGYAQAAWAPLVSVWSGLNERVLVVMQSTPEVVLRAPRARHALDRIAFRRLPAVRPVTLESFMLDYVDHLEHHLGTLFPK